MLEFDELPTPASGVVVTKRGFEICEEAQRLTCDRRCQNLGGRGPGHGSTSLFKLAGRTVGPAQYSCSSPTPNPMKAHNAVKPY